MAEQRLSTVTTDPTCYLERSKVREILIGQPDESLYITEHVLSEVDALPIFTAADLAPAQTAPEPANRLPTLDEYRNNLVKECADIARPWSGFAGVDKMGTQDREIIKVREEIAAAIMSLSVPSTDFCVRAQRPIVSVKPMLLSDNGADYFVSIKVGDRVVTPHVFREEYKAAYHVALYDWLLNGVDKEPDVVEFGPNDWPARRTQTPSSTARRSPDSKLEAYRKALEETKAERVARVRLANNGRNEANSNKGIPTLGDLHLCEMLIAQLDEARKALAAGG